MKKTQNIRITCTAACNRMLFFAENGAEKTFLFATDYYDSRIAALYRSGIALDSVISTRYPKRLGSNPFGGVRFQKLRDHILRVLRDLERESDKPIFRRKQKQQSVPYRTAA